MGVEEGVAVSNEDDELSAVFLLQLATPALSFNHRIAGRNLTVVEIVLIRGLPMREEVLGPVVARQRLSGSLPHCSHSAGLTLGKLDWVMLAVVAGQHDLHSGVIRDILDDFGQLHIHQMQGLRHMLDMTAAVTDHIVAVANISLNAPISPKVQVSAHPRSHSQFEKYPYTMLRLANLEYLFILN